MNLQVRVVGRLQERANGEIITSLPKTEAGIRVVALPAFLLPELEEHLANWAASGDDSLSFRGQGGGPLRRAVVQRHWRAAACSVGLSHMHFHDRRRTGNTLAAANGASVKELMVRMGHASPQAALRYQHATANRDAAIAAALNDMVSQVRPLGVARAVEPCELRRNKSAAR